jgi:hypothetical protein
MSFNQNLSQFSFVPRTIKGSMVAASETQPTGTDGYLYYEMVQQQQPSATVTNISANLNGYVSGASVGKKVGIIAYDYVNARWSCLFTVDVNLVGPNGQLNDKQAILDFLTYLNANVVPQTIEEASGDQLTYPASFAPGNNG